MSKREFNSLYYADDKDVFDLLSVRGMTLKKLLKFARRRGYFLSAKDGREAIIDAMSVLAHDWNQLTALLSESETPDRKEKLTARQFVTDKDIAAVVKAAEDLSVLRAAKHDEVYQIQVKDASTGQITINYSELDPTRTRLIQRRPKQIVVDFLKEGDGIKFRYNANERANEIVREVFTVLTPDKQLINERVISLSGFKEPRLRTQFFLDLMRKIEGYELVDVQSMKAYKVHPKDLESEGECEEVDELVSGDEAELVATVRKIALSGQGLLYSEEYQNLERKDFYIVHSIWRSRGKNGEKHCVEFEAEFHDAPNASDFKYTIRGVFESDEEGLLKKTKSVPSSAVFKKLSALIENSAASAMKAADTGATSPDQLDLTLGESDDVDEEGA